MAKGRGGPSRLATETRFMCQDGPNTQDDLSVAACKCHEAYQPLACIHAPTPPPLGLHTLLDGRRGLCLCAPHQGGHGRPLPDFAAGVAALAQAVYTLSFRSSYSHLPPVLAGVGLPCCVHQQLGAVSWDHDPVLWRSARRARMWIPQVWCMYKVLTLDVAAMYGTDALPLLRRVGMGSDTPRAPGTPLLV